MTRLTATFLILALAAIAVVGFLIINVTYCTKIEVLEHLC